MLSLFVRRSVTLERDLQHFHQLGASQCVDANFVSHLLGQPCVGEPNLTGNATHTLVEINLSKPQRARADETARPYHLPSCDSECRCAETDKGVCA